MKPTKARRANQPAQLRRAFGEGLRLFRRYRSRRRTSDVDQSNLIAEAQKRLEQVDWIVQRLAVLQVRAARNDRWTWGPGRLDAKDNAQHERRTAERRRLGVEIELLSESFYYFAWRLRQILVKLPEFRKLDPKGIRDVRNHLLEHPEKVSRALNPNFMYGHDLPSGPVLKPFGHRRRPIHDRGLYANASELLKEFIPRLLRVVEEEPRSQ